MASKKKEDTVSVRLDAGTLARLDRVAAELSRHASGVEVKRSDVLRLVIEDGLVVRERKLM